MDSYHFYKSLYDRELNRRKDLDSSTNLPITILTILVASNSYLLGKEDNLLNQRQIILLNLLLALLVIAFSISIFYLVRSYNNLFKGFAYRNFGLTTSIRNYEIAELPKYNGEVNESDKLNFETTIIDKLTQYTDDHIVFNDKRSRDLHKAKTFIIVTLLLTGIKLLLISLKYLTP